MRVVQNYFLRFFLAGMILAGGTSLLGFAPDFYSNTIRSITLLGQVYKVISKDYVDEVDPDVFMRAGIKGMLSTLDPYTVFFDDEENKALKTITTGKYYGVGLEIDIGISGEDRNITVIAPMDDSPAAKAGILPGDKIIEINGENAHNFSPEKVSAILRGDKNSTVNLSILREGEPEPIKYTLIRTEINVKDVTFYGMVRDSIAFVKLSHFSNKALHEMEKALSELKNQGMKGLIIDVRDNPGGLLEAAVEIANLFVERGKTLVTTKGRDDRLTRAYKADAVPPFLQLPLVILVNQGSASASEVLAGAIQDLDRGVIIGEKTFGKGLVQTISQFNQNAWLKITTARYYTPSGRCIQKIDYSRKWTSKHFTDNEDEGIDEDGNVIDTTKTHVNKIEEFKTVRGRKVFSGGGLEPDLFVTRFPDLDRFERELARRGMFFSFAVHYAFLHNTIPSPVTVNPEIYQEFYSFLDNKKFDYKIEGENELESMQKIASLKRYDPTVISEIRNVKAVLEKEKQKEMNRPSLFIQSGIEQELGARYYGTRGRIESTFDHDPQIKSAVDILKNKKKYREVFNPK